MATMKKTGIKSLWTRDGVYYLRKHVPEHLRPSFGGRAEIVKSYDTRDKRRAEMHHHDEMSAVAKQFRDAEAALKRVAAEAAHMSSPAIEQSLDEFGSISTGLERPMSFLPVVRSVADQDYVAKAKELGLGRDRPQTRAEALALVDEALEQLRHDRAEGWSLMAPSRDPDDPQPEPMVPARYLVAASDFILGQFEADERSLLAVRSAIESEDEGKPVGKAKGDRQSAASSEGLRSLAAQWALRGGPSDATKADMETAIRRFEAVNGPLPWRDITPAHVLAFKNDLINAEITVGDITRKMASATKRKLWSLVRSALMVVADDNRMIHPFANIRLGKLPADEKRRPEFTTADLRLMFQSAGGFKGDDWWLARLALYSGARLGELVPLTKADLVDDDGQICLDIHDEGEDRSVKTRNSVRKIPLHPQLVVDGFLDWAGKREGERLFSGTSGAASKRLNRHIRALKVGKLKVVHSFRHTFSTAARLVMDEGSWERITGHRPQKSSRGYGGYADLPVKMSKVSFGIETAKSDS